MVEPTLNTLVDLFQTSSEKFCDRNALVIRKGFRIEKWTYAELWRNAISAAHYFRYECGWNPDDRILVKAGNSPLWVASFIGAMMARIVWVPLDSFSTHPFIQTIADKVEPVGILTDDSDVDLAGVKTQFISDIPIDRECEAIEEKCKPKDIVEIIFTSGTTSAPKGVVLSHENIISNVMSAKNVLPAKRHRRFLSVLPLSHMFEQTCGLFLPMYLGMTIYYQIGQKPIHIKEAIRRNKINVMIVVPKLLDMMLKGIESEVKRREKWKVWEILLLLAHYLPFSWRRYLFYKTHKALGGSLEIFFSGGASLSEKTSQAWNRMGVKLIEGYGATECSPIITVSDDKNHVPGSAGQPLPGISVSIGGDGEILVKGKNVMNAYWSDESATQAVFTSDGWYRTGDKGRIDSKGNVFIQGRMTSMIALPNGINIFPEDIEVVLNAQPVIQESIVLGLVDNKNDVVLTAIVIQKYIGEVGSNLDDISDAIKNVNTMLSSHQRIGDFHIWPEDKFPKTSLGKVKRGEIKKLISEETIDVVSQETNQTKKTPWEIIKNILAQSSGGSPDKITPSSDLELDIGLTSLSMVEMSLMLESEFGISVDDEELLKLTTAVDLLELVNSGASSGQSPSIQTWSLNKTTRSVRDIFQRLIIAPLHYMVANPYTIIGEDNLRLINSPVLFVANHCSHMDTLSLNRALSPSLKGKLAVAAAADYFYANKYVGMLASMLLNTFPLAREGAVRQSMEHCADLIEEGWSVLIYPEGTRSPTGKLLPFKMGAGLLATELRIPVIPIAIDGTHKILPKGKLLPRCKPLTIRVGVPVIVKPETKPDEAILIFRSAIDDLL
jgi:long-chain acyl-CoA synthetase